MKWCPQLHAAHNQIVLQSAIINESKTSVKFKGNNQLAVQRLRALSNIRKRKCCRLQESIQHQEICKVQSLYDSEVFCHDTAHSAVEANSSQEYTYRVFTMNVGSICSRMQFPHTMSPTSMLSLLPYPLTPTGLASSFYTLHNISTWLLIEFQTKFQHYSLVFGKVMVPGLAGMMKFKLNLLTC